jgi:hypothetical protein
MQWKRWAILGLVGLGALMIFALTRAENPPSEREFCIRNWERLNDEETWVCVAVLSSDEDLNCLGNRRTMTEEQYEACVVGFSAAQETVIVSRQQTSTARPTLPPDSIRATSTSHAHTLRATSHAMWVEAGRPTVVPTRAPGDIPDGWEVVEPYVRPHGVGEGIDLRMRGMNRSAWWVGAIIADDGYPQRLLISSGTGSCVLYRRSFGLHDLTSQETKEWPCPENRGSLSLTGVTGPTGIVTATNAFTNTITFDFANEEWTLDGESWITPPTPVPGTIPPEWEMVEPYHRGQGSDEYVPIPHLSQRYLSRITDSYWWVGATVTEEGAARRWFATTYAGRCELLLMPLGFTERGTKHFLISETQSWNCPEDRGWIEITYVANDIITFTDELSRTITFDLATEEWTLEDEPWLPAATVTPTS